MPVPCKWWQRVPTFGMKYGFTSVAPSCCSVASTIAPAQQRRASVASCTSSPEKMQRLGCLEACHQPGCAIAEIRLRVGACLQTGRPRPCPAPTRSARPRKLPSARIADLPLDPPLCRATLRSRPDWRSCCGLPSSLLSAAHVSRAGCVWSGCPAEVRE